MIKSKKGASVDNFYAIAIFFLTVIFFLVLLVVWNAFSEIPNFWDQSSIGLTIRSNAQAGINTFDFILLICYISLHLGILVTAFFLRSYPIFFLVGLILAIILPMVAAPISNVYTDSIITDSNLSTYAADIPITNYVMEKLPLFEIIWSIITLIVLFGFTRWDA